MRLSILLPFAAVLGLASLSVAMPHKGSDVALQNKERGLDLSKNSLNEVFERGGGSYPSKTWQCDGTGKDGWGECLSLFLDRNDLTRGLKYL